jgi:hypothetical protein
MNTDTSSKTKVISATFWVNSSAVVLLIAIIYLGATTGSIAGLISSLFPLFSPFLLHKFLSARYLFAHKQLALSGKFMAVINIAITLLWLYTAVIDQNPQMYLLVWLVPMSLLALGIGWLVGGWLSGK